MLLLPPQMLLHRSACTRASAFIWKLEVSVGAASVGVYTEGCCHSGVDQSTALKKSCERTWFGFGLIRVRVRVRVGVRVRVRVRVSVRVSVRVGVRVSVRVKARTSCRSAPHLRRWSRAARAAAVRAAHAGRPRPLRRRRPRSGSRPRLFVRKHAGVGSTRGLVARGG